MYHTAENAGSSSKLRSREEVIERENGAFSKEKRYVICHFASFVKSVV